jgi:SAM-dependent methyltransferase
MDVALGERDPELAARRGEPSYVWRAGQERRLGIIVAGAGDRARGRVLDDGCGVGEYLARLALRARQAHGVEFDFTRARASLSRAAPAHVVDAAGENLPYASATFDLVLSHEVLEHVDDDHAAVHEIARVLRPGGRLVMFVPNRGYPFETHGVYWRGQYVFGNIPLVNYLPGSLRRRLVPHVRAYTRAGVARLLEGLPLRVVSGTVIFGAYDNLIARWPRLGRLLRGLLQALEATPLRGFGLSHVLVMEKL